MSVHPIKGCIENKNIMEEAHIGCYLQTPATKIISVLNVENAYLHKFGKDFSTC